MNSGLFIYNAHKMIFFFFILYSNCDKTLFRVHKTRHRQQYICDLRVMTEITWTANKLTCLGDTAVNVCQMRHILLIINTSQPHWEQTPWEPMFSHLFCLSRMVISAPRSRSSWQMRGRHIWVASTRGVLPSWRNTKCKNKYRHKCITP